MNKRVSARALSGSVATPASKSYMQRACAAGLLFRGKTTIDNAGNSADDLAALQTVQALGARVHLGQGNRLVIHSTGQVKPTASHIYCGESGLSARLFLPIAATSNEIITVHGSGSLLRRPMIAHINALQQMSVAVAHRDGRLPIQVHGPLQPRATSIDGRVSSQFVSGLLFALAATVTEPVSLTVINPQSLPYIDLTLEVLQHFGFYVVHKGYEQFTIYPKRVSISGECSFTVPGDWSSAAYWLVAGALSGSVTVKGLDVYSKQADRKILSILELAGIATEVGVEGVTVRAGRRPRGFAVDLTHAPDLFPIVAVLAAAADGLSHLKGLGRLTHKESDRRVSIAAMLEQLRVRHRTDGDVLVIEGRSHFPGALIDGRGDHRIVMAGAVASAAAREPIEVTDSEAVSKSYATFWTDATSLGFIATTP